MTGGIVRPKLGAPPGGLSGGPSDVGKYPRALRGGGSSERGFLGEQVASDEDQPVFCIPRAIPRTVVNKARSSSSFRRPPARQRRRRSTCKRLIGST